MKVLVVRDARQVNVGCTVKKMRVLDRQACLSVGKGTKERLDGGGIEGGAARDDKVTAAG